MTISATSVLQWGDRNAGSAVVFAMPMLAACGGSLASFLFFACLLWTLAGLALGLRILPGDRTVRTVGAILFLYFAVRFVSVFAGSAPGYNSLDAFKPLAFLAYLPFLSTPRDASVAADLPLFLRGAAIGAILGAFEGVFQIYGLGMARAEGLSGNPGPFATLMVASGGLSLALLSMPRRSDRILGFAGAAGGVAGALLAGSKGLLPAIPVVAALGVAYLARRRKVRLDRKMAIIVATTLLLALAVSAPVIKWRLVQLQDDLSNMERGQLTRSIGSRLAMWEEGLAAFAEKPVFGYGYNMRSAAVSEAVRARTGDLPGTHLHNGFITDLVGNGLIGLATHLAVLMAPFLLLFRMSGRSRDDLAVFIAGVAVSTYVVADMSSLTFGHDIMDCWYVYVLCVLTVPGRAGERGTSPISVENPGSIADAPHWRRDAPATRSVETTSPKA